MNSNNQKSYVVTVLVVLLFASMSACAQKPVAPPEQADVAKVEEPAPVEEIVEEPAMEEAMGSEEPLDTEVIAEVEAVPLEGRTSAGLYPVYFDFDKSSIRGDQVERIEKNAAFIKENSDSMIRIEGNCDERGTNEYNMALGQRRAMSAKQYLVNLGVSDSRLDTISYGEEQPINFGHDELSWSQNRRDDFVIVK